jgi:putative monooxygenase
MKPTVVKKEEAEIRRIVEKWGTLRWLASRGVGNATGITVGLVTINRGMSNPRHKHPKSEEVLHLLRGRLRHTIGDDSVDLEPGDTIVIPSGVYHNATNTGTMAAEMVVAYPAGDRDFEPE